MHKRYIEEETGNNDMIIW